MTRIIFDEEKHKYTINGEEKPSVTTILGYITADHYSSINESILRQAAQRGKDVHEACADLDYDLEVEADPVTLPYIQAYCDFLNDYRPQWEEIEQMHYNPSGDYCGTVDRMGTIHGRNCVLDIKTTASPTKANYLSYCAQTIAYTGFYKGGEDFDRYLLFLKKDSKYRLVNCKEYEEKNKMMPFFVWHKALDLYKTIKENINGK